MENGLNVSLIYFDLHKEFNSAVQHAVPRSCEEIHLKSLTNYNIIVSHMYYPLSIFVQSALTYQFNCTSTFNFITLLHILVTYTIIMVIKRKIQLVQEIQF